ncbi:MAG TPA: YciI family protein [Actinomycetota bacterium]|nr:YciI family protein [Actinomycetota bacterium]
MRFLCLAYGADDDWLALAQSERAALLAQDDVLRRRGDLVAAVGGAVTVTAWDGAPTTTDGSYARTEIPLAGFGVIEAENLEQAVSLVADTPCARAKGYVELRPIHDDTGSPP